MSIKTQAQITITDDYTPGRVRIEIHHAHSSIFLYCDEYNIFDKRKIIRTEDLVRESERG